MSWELIDPGTYIVRIHEKIYHCDPAWPDVLRFFFVSNLFEQCSFHPGWLGYIRDFTTQLYREYNQPLSNQNNGMSTGF